VESSRRTTQEIIKIRDTLLAFPLDSNQSG
jgi:hypothetical protein